MQLEQRLLRSAITGVPILGKLGTRAIAISLKRSNGLSQRGARRAVHRTPEVAQVLQSNLHAEERRHGRELHDLETNGLIIELEGRFGRERRNPFRQLPIAVGRSGERDTCAPLPRDSRARPKP